MPLRVYAVPRRVYAVPQRVSYVSQQCLLRHCDVSSVPLTLCLLCHCDVSSLPLRCVFCATASVSCVTANAFCGTASVLCATAMCLLCHSECLLCYGDILYLASLFYMPIITSYFSLLAYVVHTSLLRRCLSENVRVVCHLLYAFHFWHALNAVPKEILCKFDGL